MLPKIRHVMLSVNKIACVKRKKQAVNLFMKTFAKISLLHAYFCGKVTIHVWGVVPEVFQVQTESDRVT